MRRIKIKYRSLFEDINQTLLRSSVEKNSKSIYKKTCLRFVFQATLQGLIHLSHFKIVVFMRNYLNVILEAATNLFTLSSSWVQEFELSLMVVEWGAFWVDFAQRPGYLYV